MRIIVDKPVELLRALVKEHLTRVIPLDGVRWLTDDSEPVPDPSRYVTLPVELRTIVDPALIQEVAKVEAAKFTPVDLKALDTRIVLCGPAPGGAGAGEKEVRFEVVAGIGPECPAPFLLLTSDGTVVHAAHTNMAVHSDGVIQIGGYEARISLMTHAEIRAERGKRVLLGGTYVTSFAVEHRTNGGPWTCVNVQFNPSAVELREVRDDGENLIADASGLVETHLTLPGDAHSGGHGRPVSAATRADHRAARTSKRTAIVLGGSGSVGTALLRELFHDEGFDAVITLSRRSLPEAVAMGRTAGRRLVEKLVPDMKPASLAAATIDVARDLDGDLEGFSVLGIGAGTAKLTLEEHRAVDVALNEAFARALRDSGKVRHLAFMSAAGADPTAKASGIGGTVMSRYRRVKGESEEAVRTSGPAIVSVFRPAMIIGSQHTPWLLEKTLPLLSFVTPAKYKSVSVEQIAKAMIATAKNHPAMSASYHYPEMMALIARGQR